MSYDLVRTSSSLMSISLYYPMNENLQNLQLHNSQLFDKLKN